ncbi:helix-turn-helix domain-containing protein, partial [Bacillus sp. D-CC]
MPRLGTDLEKENYTMALQQGNYMKKSRRNLYIALEELDLVFDESEVIRFQGFLCLPSTFLVIEL